MIINFKQYITESYLKGGRQPLYHYTSRLVQIMRSDTLKTSKPVYGEKNSISFTRSLYYKEHFSPYRLVLDVDLLIKDGYKLYPYDEVANAISDTKNNNNYSKVNPYNKDRYVNNNLGIGDKNGLEFEYEERCYENITNLGKYLIAIDITEYELIRNIDEIKFYLDKYPHTQLVLLNYEKLYDRRKNIDFNKLYDRKRKNSDIVKIEDYILTT